MSRKRGINVFFIPDHFSSLNDALSGRDGVEGPIQYRDILVVRPSPLLNGDYQYKTKGKIYQVDYQTQYGGTLIATEITAFSIPYIFTDDDIIPNVTILRKAHQDDYRALLKYIKDTFAKKYGDTYNGLHEYQESRIRFLSSNLLTNITAASMYIVKDTVRLNIGIAQSLTIGGINSADEPTNNATSNHPAFSSDYLRVDSSVPTETIRGEGTGLFGVGLPAYIYNNLSIIDGDIQVIRLPPAVPPLHYGTHLDNVSISAETGNLYNINTTRSTHTNMVTNFNADMVDGMHWTDINARIPKLYVHSFQATVSGRYSAFEPSYRSNGYAYYPPDGWSLDQLIGFIPSLAMWNWTWWLTGTIFWTGTNWCQWENHGTFIMVYGHSSTMWLHDTKINIMAIYKRYTGDF